MVLIPESALEGLASNPLPMTITKFRHVALLKLPFQSILVIEFQTIFLISK